VLRTSRNDGWRGIAVLRLQWQREMLLQKYQLINTVTNSVIARHEVPRQSILYNSKKSIVKINEIIFSIYMFGLFYVVFWIASSVVALPPRNDGWRGIAVLRLQ
jgi:hypothetical protein